MIPGVEMITEGGTSATIRFSKNTGDCDYSLSVAVLIPSMFEDCAGRQDLEHLVACFGETHKKFFMDLYFPEMIATDARYECMKAFDGNGDASGYECFVGPRVEMLPPVVMSRLPSCRDAAPCGPESVALV